MVMGVGKITVDSEFKSIQVGLIFITAEWHEFITGITMDDQNFIKFNQSVMTEIIFRFTCSLTIVFESTFY